MESPGQKWWGVSHAGVSHQHFLPDFQDIVAVFINKANILASRSCCTEEICERSFLICEVTAQDAKVGIEDLGCF